MVKLIKNARVILRDEIAYNIAIAFEKVIIALVKEDEIEVFINEQKTKDKEVEIIDAKGLYVSAGFIDIHIHGAGGYDTMDGSLEGIKNISKVIASKGVTSFLPTTMTMDKEKIYKALDVVREAMDLENMGAKVLGAHMEGPFINEIYKGAQSKEYILKPEFKFIENYTDVIKIITLAPECDDNLSFVKKVLKDTDIVLSIGHTNASYEDAMEAIECGVNHATHMFNAMTPLNHRKPGVVGAIFNSDIYCELIADKIHVHKELFKLINTIKGKDKVILITDSMRAGCLKDGISELGGQKVIVKDNSARLEDGTLAGSILTLNVAVKNYVENTDLELYDIINMVSLNPATNLGIEKQYGSLDVGKFADIVMFDENIDIKQTIVVGERVY